MAFGWSEGGRGWRQTANKRGRERHGEGERERERNYRADVRSVPTLHHPVQSFSCPLPPPPAKHAAFAADEHGPNRQAAAPCAPRLTFNAAVTGWLQTACRSSVSLLAVMSVKPASVTAAVDGLKRQV